MSARVATSVLVSGLIRAAETVGGFAAVLAKGDPTAGSVVVILTERHARPRVLERLLQAEGGYAWVASSSQISENMANVPAFVASRRRFDPDLWVLELDVPCGERFAAGMAAFD